ncbi:MAG: hypothetical protein QM759_14760 [Terricaulis sp.]
MTRTEPITQARVEAIAASALCLLGWLLGAILRLNPAGRSARLAHWLERAERGVEHILFLKALARYGPPPQRRRHPRSAPPGFRRVGRSTNGFFRSARIRARKANAFMRVLALIDALARPERAVAYFLKQICKGLRLSALVAIAPPAFTFCSTASAIDGDFRDSS